MARPPVFVGPGNSGSVLEDARQPSLVQLSGVVVEAFDRVEHFSRARRAALRAGTAVALLAYERRVHESGQAVCLLGLRWLRVIGGVGALMLATVLAGAVSPDAAVALLIVVAGVLLPLGVAGARALPAQARLAHKTPRGRHKHVYSLASTKRGAGRELMLAVCREADADGWSLVLDAGSEKLVGYYETFGFHACGAPVKMPNGRRHVRMCRPSQDRKRAGGTGEETG